LKYPNEVQEELLMNLLQSARNTVLGKNMIMDQLPMLDLPIRFRFRPTKNCNLERTRQGEQNVFWETPIKWFKSSGTTNAKSKFIPVSNEALEDCHYKGSKTCVSI
jgi:hypothetical protein